MTKDIISLSLMALTSEIQSFYRQFNIAITSPYICMFTAKIYKRLILEGKHRENVL